MCALDFAVYLVERDVKQQEGKARVVDYLVRVIGDIATLKLCHASTKQRQLFIVYQVRSNSTSVFKYDRQLCVKAY
jgi:hypothetical protein